MKNTKHEELLNGLSIFILIAGVILGIICLCYCDISRMEHIGSRYGTTFNATMFTTGIFSILGGIIQYAFFRVVIEISLSLKGGISMYSDKSTTPPIDEVTDSDNNAIDSEEFAKYKFMDK